MNEINSNETSQPTSYESYRASRVGGADGGAPSGAAAGAQHPAPADVNQLLNDKNSAYWRADHPQHHAAVARVSEYFQAAHPEAAPASTDIAAPEVVANVQELRMRVGVDYQLPRQLEQHWSKGAEADVLAFAIRENIPGHAMSRVLQFYVDRAVLSGTGTVTDADIAEFERDAPSWGLTPAQAQKLIEWERAWSGRR
jgi:hypothetical protein